MRICKHFRAPNDWFRVAREASCSKGSKDEIIPRKGAQGDEVPIQEESYNNISNTDDDISTTCLQAQVPEGVGEVDIVRKTRRPPLAFFLQQTPTVRGRRLPWGVPGQGLEGQGPTHPSLLPYNTAFILRAATTVNVCSASFNLHDHVDTASFTPTSEQAPLNWGHLRALR